MKKKDPKVGTGKKPKGSGRRLYTDENPKDTVSIKFATMDDAKATIAKVKRLKKPYARKIQILTVAEQRAKVMKKTAIANLFKAAKASSTACFVSSETVAGVMLMRFSNACSIIFCNADMGIPNMFS